MSDTSKLTQLGGPTLYPQHPDLAVIETFQNVNKKNSYIVPFVQERDEFTSLCPKTGQPDHARMEIIYVPNDKMIESKSLKLYLFSFRNSGEFHEDVVCHILDDLVKAIEPKYLRVFGDFAPRGGLAIKPIAEYWDEDISEEDREEVERLVDIWDLKSC